MEKYGNKLVVKSDDFYEGIVVETARGGRIVAREYTKNEYDEKVVGEEITEFDFVEFYKIKTPIGKMRKIARKLGTGKFAIDEDVVEMIE